MKIGTGWDIHPLVAHRPLIIGGVTIPHDLGEAGHSDGDVLLHALIDALLGSQALGDIGKHFPPSDARYKDIRSTELLQSVLQMIPGWEIVHIDTTIILEQPKLSVYIKEIRESIASLCQIPLERVSVKAKTAEGLLGEVGTGTAIIAQAMVLMQPIQSDIGESVDIWV